MSLELSIFLWDGRSSGMNAQFFIRFSQTKENENGISFRGSFEYTAQC